MSTNSQNEDNDDWQGNPVNISITDQQHQKTDSQDERSFVRDSVSEADERSQNNRSRPASALNSSQNLERTKDSKHIERTQSQQLHKSGEANFRRTNWNDASSNTREYHPEYRRSSNVSPHLQTEFEKTQKVLEQARARSREQVFINPSGGNGYEKHNGSPQRTSPKRDTYINQNRVVYRNTTTNRIVSHSPLQETQNIRSQIHREEPQHQVYLHNARGGSRDSDQQFNQIAASVHKEKENSNQLIRHSSSSHARTNEHRKTSKTEQGSAIKYAETIHDSIINSYRCQLQNSANLDSMYEALRMRIAEVQSRRSQMEDSIRYMCQDFEKQIEQQTTDAEILQKELETLKRHNADLGQDCNTVNSDIMDSKTMLNQKELEVQRMRTDIIRSHDEGRFLKENIEEAKRQLAINYKTKDQQHQKIFQLVAMLKQQESQNFSATSDSNKKTAEVNNLFEQVRRLNDTLHNKTIKFEDASTKFEIARAELLRNQAETKALQKDCENANQRNSFLLETQRQLVRQKESESGRSKELNIDISRAESTYIYNDNELQALARELEAVRRSNESLLEAGHCYKQELHALQNHADLLALQNNDLQKELDEFVYTDDIIRNGLDRKNRIENMKQQNNFKTMQSMNIVEKSRSPARGPSSRSPLRPMTNTQQPNSLTQAYLSYHRQEAGANQTYQHQSQASIQELCRRQLQENMRNQEQTNTFNMRDMRRSDGSGSPVQYRARNGSPLRRSPSNRKI